MEWIIKLPTDGGCSSASSSVSKEEDGSVKITFITVITVVLNSRTSVRSLVRRMVSEYL